MDMVKVFPTVTGYHPKLGALVIGQAITITEDQAIQFGAILSKEKTAPAPATPEVGKIDLTDGVSEAEAKLAGRTLATKKKQTKKEKE